MTRPLLVAALTLLAVVCRDHAPRAAAQVRAPAMVVETQRGTFVVELFEQDAPVSVAHVTKLVASRFYDGQRVHRAVPGFVVQFGDPQTRDTEARARWGKGDAAASGTPVGIAEVGTRRRHTALAVGLAHMGEPAKADSQLYITLAPRPDLDGRYAVIGRVFEGEEVPALLQVGDEIRRVYLRE